MAISSISGSAVQGIQRSVQGLRRAAVQVAQGVDPAKPVDYSRSLVEMKQHAVQVKASTRALKAYNETLGTLLDIKA